MCRGHTNQLFKNCTLLRKKVFVYVSTFVKTNPPKRLSGYLGGVKKKIGMTANLCGRYEPTNDCLRNQTTGVGLMIGKRRKPSHNKPPLYLLRVFEDGSQKYVSSLYPHNEKGGEGSIHQSFGFDCDGVRYHLNLNTISFSMEVIELKNQGKVRGGNQSVSSNIITDLGAIFAPPYGAKVGHNHNENQTKTKGGFQSNLLTNQLTKRRGGW